MARTTASAHQGWKWTARSALVRIARACVVDSAVGTCVGLPEY